MQCMCSDNQDLHICTRPSSVERRLTKLSWQCHTGFRLYIFLSYIPSAVPTSQWDNNVPGSYHRMAGNIVNLYELQSITTQKGTFWWNGQESIILLMSYIHYIWDHLECIYAVSENKIILPHRVWMIFSSVIVLIRQNLLLHQQTPNPQQTQFDADIRMVSICLPVCPSICHSGICFFMIAVIIMMNVLLITLYFILEIILSVFRLTGYFRDKRPMRSYVSHMFFFFWD